MVVEQAIGFNNKLKKNMKVIYQSGVDVLGFPIYVEHYITFGKSNAKFNRKNGFWKSVIQKIIKQH